jgi:2-keto-4-pentenoate hydratase/2-oxohepta-3-ene-1,7-dioic acid hydratase in catechol pathway
MARYVQFTVFGKRGWGRAIDGGIQPVSSNPFDGGIPVDQGAPLSYEAVHLEVPSQPTKIVCIGRNYADHAAELGHDLPTEPLMFLKPPSALLAHQGAIVYPVGQSSLVHHEGELGIVIGRRTRNVAAADWRAHVFGFTIVNDVTARDLQRKDVQFTRAKGFDTFCPVGPWVDTDFVPDDQRVTVRVNGELRQDGHLRQMIFPVPALIEAISRVMTLEQGDIIATGTPSGVGPLLVGDEVEVAIDGLGVLVNTVTAPGDSRLG